MRSLTIHDCLSFATSQGLKCLEVGYRNNYTKMMWQCICGDVFEASFHDVKSGKRCVNRCKDNRGVVKKFGLDDCKRFAESKNGQCVSIEYVNCKTKLIWICEAGHVFEADFDHVKNSNRWCRNCAGKDTNFLVRAHEFAASRGGLCLSLSIEYAKQQCTWRCREGHIWISTFNTVQSGSWCPICPGIISKAQQDIYGCLISIYLGMDVILNDTQTISPFDLDIHIPSLKLAIEYDGEYWHYSDWAIENGSLRRMRKKDRLCGGIGIKLMRIRESDWNANPELELQSIIDWIDGELK